VIFAQQTCTKTKWQALFLSSERAPSTAVIAGLDPAIHEAAPRMQTYVR
jgi:hypothetical protein